ncbi:hypothetical protein P3T23_008784 [Paraburkholderia sp. GAS448]
MSRRASRRTHTRTTKPTSRPAPKAGDGAVWLQVTLFVIGLGVQTSHPPAAVTAAYWLFFAAVVLLSRSRKKKAPGAPEQASPSVAAPEPEQIPTKPARRAVATPRITTNEVSTRT